MTTHSKCASNCKCIDRHRDLFLFCLFALVFSIFSYSIFLFELLLEQGYINVTLFPMQPVGWEYPPPAASPTTAAGATAAVATPQPPPHAAVQPGLQQPSTTPWSMQPQVLAVRTTVSVWRATLSLCALRKSSLRVLCLVFADAVPDVDPVLPNAASVAHAAIPVTSCLTAAVSHAVPRWVAHLGHPSARQSSSGPSAASALQPTASAAAAANAAAASAGYSPASRQRTTAAAAAAGR